MNTDDEATKTVHWESEGADSSKSFLSVIIRVIRGSNSPFQVERDKFRQFLGEYSAFCGIRILTWCILSNHFHLLLEVPRKPEEPPSLEELNPKA